LDETMSLKPNHLADAEDVNDRYLQW